MPIQEPLNGTSHLEFVGKCLELLRIQVMPIAARYSDYYSRIAGARMIERRVRQGSLELDEGCQPPDVRWELRCWA
jgi:hypothetical protein